ncbi:hypothetical protein SAMN04515666_108155 [Bosea lupini]|uniref:Uncharacterized protein n=1 Tax=Bosea lupini TaxID=1036779 RepID=A0A1H7WH46_9HYPH|nr:hypothetical protein [Bosea lupini]SEM20358.1 hypothetical protein SAMN04515666_108155 [Bosea lupini]
MSGKPSTQATVIDVVTIVISEDPAEGAIIKLEIDGSTDVELVFEPMTLAKLQTALTKMDKVQAKASPAQ